MKKGWLKISLAESRKNVEAWPQWKRDLQEAIKAARRETEGYEWVEPCQKIS